MHSHAFIDWIDIYQVYPEGGLPIVASGFVAGYDEDGAEEFRSVKSHRHEGSFDTVVLVSCDGSRVRVAGNVGRLGRPDNLWNLDFAATVRKANSLLERLGLPPFTTGRRLYNYVKGRWEWTGARLVRIDVTTNLATYSDLRAREFLRALADVSVARVAKGSYKDETVTWGNKMWYLKAYLKHVEMAKHKHCPPEVLDYARDMGLVRIEAEFKRRLLQDHGLYFLGDVTMAKVVKLFDERIEPLKRVDTSVDLAVLEQVPLKYRVTADAWLRGADLKGEMTNGTFYRHRKALLEYGIDISTPRNMAQVHVITRYVDLTPVAPPDWYQLDSRRVAA
nr:phage/plasmid replication protein [Ralstonia mannitolilytica]